MTFAHNAFKTEYNRKAKKV